MIIEIKVKMVQFVKYYLTNWKDLVAGCTWDKEAKQQHLAQVEICFDKSFKLTCNPSWRAKAKVRSIKAANMPEVEPCRSNEQVCYTPIQH